MTQNNQLTVTLTPECRLEQALKQAGVINPASVTKLTLEGIFDYKDSLYISKTMSKTLKELDIGKTIVEDNSLFDYEIGECIGLISITIPELVNELWWNRNDHLTSIIVPPENPVFSSHCGVLFNKDMTELLYYPTGRQSDYIIPNGVVKIEFSAFSENKNLSSIVIPDSVLEIGDSAFIGCTGLSSVIIPNSVRIIDGSFCRCTGITSINIPNSVIKIGAASFYLCTGLKSVFIPASVIIIGKKSFDDCPAYITVHPDNPVFKSENGKLIRK
jgi:hypothetical protein